MLRDERRNGYVTIRAVHLWGPFLLQLAMGLGGYFALQQRVSDMQDQLTRMQQEIVELRMHLYR